jgi:predicted PurR-regulated permease PerM
VVTHFEIQLMDVIPDQRRVSCRPISALRVLERGSPYYLHHIPARRFVPKILKNGFLTHLTSGMKKNATVLFQNESLPNNKNTCFDWLITISSFYPPIIYGYMTKESQKIESMSFDDKVYIASQIIICVALVSVLKLGLLPALLAGLLVYQLVDGATNKLAQVGVNRYFGRIFAVVAIAIIVFTAIGLGAVGITSFFNGSSGGLIVLLSKMADAIDTVMVHFPEWMQSYVPTNVVDLQTSTAAWLRANAAELRHVGQSIGTSLVYLLTGMIIGGMVSFGSTRQELSNKPLTKTLVDRITVLSTSFRRVVFSQVKISSINTILTSIFLVVIMPAFGVPLPLTKTMIAVTFIVGLLPVIGNLISNTVIVLIGLGVSPYTAMGSLVFLILIHKLEYFLNAHIVGTNIRARAWEILLAMLVMETAFGIGGMIAAPIYYAYLKDELAERNLI